MKLLFSFLAIITAILIAYSDLASKTIFRRTQPLLNNITKTSTYSTASANNMTTPREIKFSFLAREQSEGAGATVRRSIGSPKLKNFSPFLMLDHFRVPQGAGFPDHPHRGQETITYLLQGSVDHEDFAGNAGTIGPGDLQFMTAGRGIMHAEMPGKDSDTNIGMQLWVDLPAHLKDCEPRYRDLKKEEIPTAKSDDGKVEVKVISGKSLGVDSLQDLAYTPVWLLDITVRPGGKITQELPVGWNAFAYTLEGVTTFSNGSKKGQTITPYYNVVFEQSGDSITAEVEEGADAPGRFIIIAGTPLDQPVVQYGPFVQTSREGIMKAMTDFQTASNGFERSLNWESEIGKAMGRVH